MATNYKEGFGRPFKINGYVDIHFILASGVRSNSIEICSHNFFFTVLQRQIIEFKISSRYHFLNSADDTTAIKFYQFWWMHDIKKILRPLSWVIQVGNAVYQLCVLTISIDEIFATDQTFVRQTKLDLGRPIFFGCWPIVSSTLLSILQVWVRLSLAILEARMPFGLICHDEAFKI